MNVQCKRCGLGKTRLRHPSLPFDSFPYPTRTIRRRVRSVNHVTTKGKEVDHNLWVWGSVPRALRARGSPANTCENITSAATALITTQIISSRPDRVSGSTRLSNVVRFVHFTVRIPRIRTKIYELLFMNKQFGP